MARTVDLGDAGEVERALRASFDAALDGQLPRLLEILMDIPRRDGPDYIATRSDGSSVRINASYGRWTLSRPRLADRAGTGLATLALALATLQPGHARAKPLELYHLVNRMLGLDLSVDQLLSDAQSRRLVHAILPAPAHYLPIPTPEQIKAEADRGSKDLLVSLFNQATAIYRYENTREEFCYYKLRLEDKVNDEKRFIRAAYTAHDGLRVEGARLSLLLGNRLPIYNVAELARRPEATVLWVEGEKTQAAAAARFPDYVVVSIDSPTKPEDTDWSPLIDRDILLFPDADEPGVSCVQRCLAAIRLAASVRTTRTKRDTPPLRLIIPLPEGLSLGHDLADPDPPGMAGWAEQAIKDAFLPDADTARLNEQFIFVNDLSDGEAYVLVKTPFDATGTGRPVARLSQRELHSHYVNDLRVIARGRNSIEVPASQIWIESPYRETVNAVICDPSPHYIPRPGIYNYWQGFATQPEQGEFPTIQTLLNALHTDQEVILYIKRFLASIFQRPHRVPLASLVIRGRQGVGKSLFAQILELMVGYRHALRSTNPEIEVLGDFNELVEGRILLILEEFSPKTQSKGNGQGKLKNLITSDTLLINGKGLRHRQVRNYSHVIITSNEETTAPSGPDSRRFVYVTMEPNLPAARLQAFAEETVNARNAQHPELRAFLYHLLYEIDLVGWNSAATPDTTDQRLNRAAAIDEDSLLSWWVSTLEAQHMFGIPFAGWTRPRELYLKSYEHFCTNNHITRRVGPQAFHQRLSIYLYGRNGDNMKLPRQRAVSSSVGLTEEQCGMLGISRDLVNVYRALSLPRLLQILQHETGHQMSAQSDPERGLSPGDQSSLLDPPEEYF